MKFSLTVIYQDGTTEEIEAQAADIVAFETRFEMSMTALGKDTWFTHMLYIAWHVLKRTGATKETFEKWIERVDTIEAGEEKK